MKFKRKTGTFLIVGCLLFIILNFEFDTICYSLVFYNEDIFLLKPISRFNYNSTANSEFYEGQWYLLNKETTSTKTIIKDTFSTNKRKYISNSMSKQDETYIFNFLLYKCVA